MALLLLVLVPPRTVSAQSCDSALPTGTITGAVNTYYPGTGTSAAGATQVTVDSAAVRGASVTLAAGDMLLVMQIQDAQINDDNDSDYGDGAGGLAGAGSTAVNNSGIYEYVVAQSGLFTGGACPAGSTCIAIRGVGPNDGLLSSYTTAGRLDIGNNRRGQRSYQVIRVARYATGTLGAGLVATAWNGRTGGVLAVDVAGALALGGLTVSVDGMGYRAGIGESSPGQAGLSNTDYRRPDSSRAHARKGEGIACTPISLSGVPGGFGQDGCPRGDKARGAPGNAGGGGTDGDPGGNDQNSGGGGGGNGGAGGIGGSSLAVGGRGGAALASTNGRLFLGGGGGAGTSNDAGPGTGAVGGGLVMIRAGSVSGNGTISSRGLDAACSAQDAAGGGGAGGTIFVYAEAGSLAGLSAVATGGRGGDANLGTCAVSGGAQGPGGGGGGGVVFTSSAVAGGSSVLGGSNGLTTGNIAFGSAAGSSGPPIDVTLTAAGITGVQACTTATLATVAGLRTSPGWVEFATGTQRRTLAFNVYGTRDPQGRGPRRRLNERPLRAPRPDSLAPIVYRAQVKPSDDPYVLIEEIETSGRRRLLGPFPREDERLALAFERAELRAAPRGRSAGASATVAPPNASPRFPERVRAVKVEVAQAGRVVVPLAHLAAAGLAIPSPTALRVWSLGQPVPSAVVSGNTDTALVFQAEALSTDYTGRNVYVVTAGGSAPRPSVAWTRSGPTSNLGFLRIGPGVWYAPWIHPQADPWVWGFVTADEPAELSFDLPGLGPGPELVAVQVHLVGDSNRQHGVAASLNGVDLGRVVWEGAAPTVLTAYVPRETLRPAGNALRLQDASGTDSDLVLLDAVDLDLALAAPSADVAADRVAPYDPSLPDLRGVDYLIVTHADFTDVAQRLAGVKRAQGLNPLVVDVDRAYDRHASGVVEAGAVRALLQEYAKAGRAHYVVLVGDDTFDPRDFLGLGLRSFVPSLMAWDGERVPSEARYADVDGDGSPDLAIGRLPVNTPAEATVLVDKIERAAAGAPAGGTVVAVDNDGIGDVSFRQLAERVPAWFGPVTWADGNQGFAQARQTLLAALAGGASAVHYFGHGAADRWADEALLMPADLAGLPGTGGQAVLFAWTCRAQWYQYDGGPSLHEALLLVPEGGVAASFGPSGVTDPHLQKTVSERVYKSLRAGLPLGDAIRLAKREALFLNPGVQPVVDGWNLLGDPAQPVRARAIPR